MSVHHAQALCFDQLYTSASLAHILAVARRAEALAHILQQRGCPRSECDVLIQAAWLYTIGTAPGLRCSGFHPLDGASYLRRIGEDRLACIVAHHSGSWLLGRAQGVRQIEEYPPEWSFIAHCLTALDMTTGPQGEQWTVGQRIHDVCQTYGSSSPQAQAARAIRDECIGTLEAIHTLAAPYRL